MTSSILNVLGSLKKTLPLSSTAISANGDEDEGEEDVVVVVVVVVVMLLSVRFSSSVLSKAS